MIAWAASNGIIIRVRRAWYAVRDTDRERVLATMLGGRLGGMSSARSYGLWTGLDTDLHVSWSPHGNVAKPGRAVELAGGLIPARFLDDRFGVTFPDGRRGDRLPASRLDGETVIVTHWRQERFGHPRRLWRESLAQTLAQVIVTADFRDAVACCDSAMNRRLLTLQQVHRIIAALPISAQSIGRSIDGSAGSGIETYVRLWLDGEGCGYRTQVQIGPHRVDFLVGTSLIVEADGEQFHSDAAKFEADRVRTAYLQARGYTVIRLSYRMIMWAWASCEQLIRAEIARGRHLDRVR